MSELWPYSLTWADVDPSRHPFDLDEHAAHRLAVLVVPLLPDASTIDDVSWPLTAVTEFLVQRYGQWACGWNWSIGEGDLDGGVVGAWCCAAHTVTTPEATAPLVVEALREWRSWLDELRQRFIDLAPPTDVPVASVDPWHWERACTRLVTMVADRTEAESGWYGHCMQVLHWFLASHGISEERAEQIVEKAVGGRFDSWMAPDATVVDEVSTRFAQAISQNP
ncbi:hypothetical protein AB0M28_07055 [Streptomyces sp. NPDC051940]|uniref:hypothetical protein n=1 Tax=Streptomyces sp. NPDC051940 TaxID=3155675 RepID=UPI0034208845